MAPTVLYIACLLGAVALYLLVRSAGEGVAGRSMRAAGALLGIGVFGFLVVRIGDAAVRPGFFYLMFSALAVFSAVKVITHPRPVYSALFFVLVVIASAGLFLMLEAEFMAFALIIVYAGAILITYMFVLMLARQAPDPEHEQDQPDYDRMAREPVAGAIVGFILLALLTGMLFAEDDGLARLAPRVTVAEAREETWNALLELPERRNAVLVQQGVDPADLPADRGTVIDLGPGNGARFVYGDGQAVELPEEAMPENVQRVGLELIETFPVSLEVAGVILLMAMFGAVILARRQIELTEDEKRETAGMRRLGHHDESAPAGGGAG